MIDDVLAGLTNKTRKRIQLASEVTIEKLPLASTSLTKNLGGGVVKGRMTMFWGVKSAGKTTLLLQSIARWQKEGQKCAWIDVEGAYDPVWAEKLGVDNDSLAISFSKSAKDVTEDCKELMAQGVDVIVIDSITALVPDGWYEKKTDEIKELQDTYQIGTQAKSITNMCQVLSAVNKNTAILFISQARKKIESYGAFDAPTGGQGIQFYCSSVVKLHASKTDKEQKKELVEKFGRLVELPVAREVTHTVEYNKVGPPSHIGNYMLYYDGPEIGIDNLAEDIDVALELGLISHSGAWFKYKDEKIQGLPKVVEYFKTNIDEYEELKGKIDEA